MEKIRSLYEKHRETINYIFFGGVTTVVNTAVSWGCHALGMGTVPANTAAWIVSVLVAYYTNRRWVFMSHSRGADAWREFLSFVGCRVGTLLIDDAVMHLGVDRLGPSVTFVSDGLWYLAVKVAANVIVLILNYVFSKLIIFRKKDGE